MALPNEIQVGRYNAVLHKLLDMKEGAPAPSLAPDIFSMIALEVDRPEWKFLAGERMCIGALSQAAGGAGTFGTLVLWNPSGSGVLAVLEKVRVYDSANRSFSIRVASVNPSGIGYSQGGAYRGLRDLRFGTTANSKPSCLLYRSATASPTGNTVSISYVFVAGPVEQALGFVIPPGTGISLADVTANEAFSIEWTWRERVMSASESR